MKTYDLHIHSKYSACSNLKLKIILKFAKKRKLDGIAVTDHNTMKGALQLKKLNNLESIYNSGILEKLEQTFSPESVSVIGSYSTGEDIEESDIDLVLISKTAGDISLKKYEKMLNRKIHLMVVDYDSLSDEFYTNLINGIVLDGFIRKK